MTQGLYQHHNLYITIFQYAWIRLFSVVGKIKQLIGKKMIMSDVDSKYILNQTVVIIMIIVWISVRTVGENTMRNEEADSCETQLRQMNDKFWVYSKKIPTVLHAL